MNPLKSQTFGALLPTVYMIAVISCIPLAFDYIGRVDSTWLLVLIVLTLPWSLVSLIFAWSLFHGAGLEFFTVMYVVFGVINATLMYLICRALRRHDERISAR